MKDQHQIAIMTWYTYQNYGSVLQASSLYYSIQKLGYEPKFIHYLPKGRAVSHPRLDLAKRALNKLKGRTNTTYSSKEQTALYSNYLLERTSCTALCKTYSELYDLNQEFDAFVCGSDQIWSPLCYDSKYFLDFVENTDKMVAYAPSIGSTKIGDPIIREKMAQRISRFKHLAVREQQGANLIKELTGQDAEIVLDPTLLMNVAEWNEFAGVDEVQKIDGKYILCYFLGEAGKYMSCVRTLSKKLNIPFYVIPVTTRQKNGDNAVPFEVGPREFVSLIRNAEYVVTDSFHGMAFSVNYNVPFSIFKRFKDNDPKNQNSRIFNLLQMLGLEDRLVDYTNTKNIQAVVDCDFTEANQKLEDKRDYSIGYLKNALASAVKTPTAQKALSFKITDMCCGCGACSAVCAKGAISIYKNDEGFEHYSIDTTKCVRCGQCKTVCPMTNITAPQMKESKALYSVKSRSEQVLKGSSSGGVGHEIASELLANGYAVCGCTYDPSDNSAKHIWIMPGQADKISLLQGSKYIQSVTAEAMKQIVELAETTKIAFFGTPCQAAAVDKILRKKNLRDQAIIVDLICHGVPSYFLWVKYLSDIDKKHGTGAHPAVLFRSKEREWRRRLLLVDGNGQVYKKEENKDDFYAFFRRGLCYMESCSDCPYRERSAADLRIGDYWGDRFAYDKQGVSMVISNTTNGDDLINTIEFKKTCDVSPHNLTEYWSVQFPYNQTRPLIREQLITELKNDNIALHTLRKKYCAYYDQMESITKIIRFVRKIVKR